MIQFDKEKEQNAKVKLMHEHEEEELARILSAKYEIAYIDLTNETITTDALRVIPEKRARAVEAAAFATSGMELSVAVRSPGRDDVKALVNELTKKDYRITLYMVSKKSLEFAWSRYKDLSYAQSSEAGALSISDEDVTKFMKQIHDASDAKKFIENILKMKRAYRISRIVEIFMASALATEASDLHIEPEKEQVRLRFRLDGLLTDITIFNRDTYKLLLSRIKLLSGLKLNVKSEAQDGRFSISVQGDEIEIRTSILPGEYGEALVLRILNPNAIRTSIEELGMHPRLLKKVFHEIDKPNGMIINTGPTGSGKTTTLYSFLTHVSNPNIKIITIEDPIEYHLKGLVQTQVNREKDYTFASGLRAALRQDPDVIMIGEIRDTETAEIAIHAALTGHLVFSTLHTNDALGSFPRLVDMGINPQIIGPAMNITMAQRLVRKLCEKCKQPLTPDAGQRAFLDEIVASIQDQSYVQGVTTSTMWGPGSGCTQCGGVGYKGRIGIFEAIIVDDEIAEAIRNMASDREVQELTQKQNILSMKQDGVVKILQGITSLTELSRVIDLG